MFKVYVVNDAGHGTINAYGPHTHETEVDAKLDVEHIVKNGFWGTAEATPFSGESSNETFFCPRYIKRITITEEEPK